MLRSATTNEFRFDPGRRLIDKTLRLAKRTITAYDQERNTVSTDRDLDGRSRTVTDPNGNVRTYTYWDATRDWRLKGVISPLITSNGAGPSLTSDRSIQSDYDENGNVIQVVDIPASG